MRKAILLAIILAAVACLCFLYRTRQHGFRARTYFHNAQGLQPGAHVRMNGIEVGSVRDVRISGERKDKPVEVLVALNARYAPHIPNDALASLETEGVLGPTFVELDSSKANGAPVQDNCLLQSVDPDNNATAHFLEVVGNALLKEADKLREKGAQPRSGDK